MIPQHFDRQPLGWRIRSLLVVAAAGLAGLLVLARTLEPDPRGFGTHTQLGLAALCIYDRDRPTVPELRHDHVVRVVGARADRSFLESQSGRVYLRPAERSVDFLDGVERDRESACRFPEPDETLWPVCCSRPSFWVSRPG